MAREVPKLAPELKYRILELMSGANIAAVFFDPVTKAGYFLRPETPTTAIKLAAEMKEIMDHYEEIP